jgi:hypothetical protein
MVAAGCLDSCLHADVLRTHARTVGRAAAYKQGFDAISSGMVVVRVTLFMSAPTVFSLARLSELHARASSDSRREELIAAAESVLAADIWHGSAALFGGLLLEAGLLWISALMLRLGGGFPRWLGLLGWRPTGSTSYTGPSR